MENEPLKLGDETAEAHTKRQASVVSRSSVSNISNKGRKPKPVDLWLVLASSAVGILFWLFPKTPITVVLGTVFIFGLLLHPAWNLPWIEDYLGRRVFTIFLLAAVCTVVGYITWPTKEGYMTFKCEVFSGAADIEEGKRFGVNVGIDNLGQSRVFNVSGFSVIEIFDNVTVDTDRKARQWFEEGTADTRGRMLTDGTTGPTFGEKQGFYITAKLNPLTKQQVEAILAGTARIYVLSWAAWQDSDNNWRQAYDCRWLQSLPGIPYKKDAPVWQVCR